MIDDEVADLLAFYPSTIRHAGTGERLLSVSMLGGKGLRLDIAQVTDLHDMLGAYLQHALPEPEAE